jgi:ubiquinone/menaquinone biosynthesis C-methylase UbiE
MKRDIASYRTRLQDQAAAGTYAARFERGSRRGIDRREQRAVRRIFAQLPDCRSVLDVPSGAGRFLAALAQNGRDVIEVDVAEEALELAKQRAAELRLKARFIPADASKLPLPDNTVDAVFSNRLLHHITSAAERAVFLREFRRVARRYVIVSFFDYRSFGSLRQFLKRLKGRRVNYTGQPTLAEFTEELIRCAFRVRQVVPTGPAWVAQKYFVLEKPAERL